jgi:low affinity Fe/Cu permease
MNISRFARACSDALGSSKAFISACILILLWALLGPIFQFSETWQLVINTMTTILTFLAMFLLQHSQNTDTKALHLKLDELIASSRANNAFIAAEKLEDLSHLEALLANESH